MTPSATTRPTGLAPKFLLTVVGGFGLGLATLPITITPGYPAPLNPAAGLGLAAVLLAGPALVPAVGIAAFGVVLAAPALLEHRAPDPTLWWVALAFAIGAALQAYLGSALVQRQVHDPQTLAEPGDLARFLGAAALACLVGAGIDNFALAAAGVVRPSELPFALLAGWLGDLLGVLIAVPVILALRGKPREAWMSRRASVASTLLILTLLVASAIRHFVRQEQDDARHEFDRHAGAAAQALTAQLLDSLQALEALHGLFIGSDEVTEDKMALATRAWLVDWHVQALGWSVPVRRGDVPAFEASVRASGNTGYRVVDPTGSRPDDELVVLRFVEPVAGNAERLGKNALARAAERTAVEQARRSGQAVASGVLQDGSPQDPVEIVIYRALYDAPDIARLNEAVRSASTRGLVAVTLRPASELVRLEPGLVDGLSICLVDVTSGAEPTRLAGKPGCESARPGIGHTRPLRFAARDWQIRVAANAGRPASTPSFDAWLFAFVSLVSTAGLGGFLLTVTGRARRIELEVSQRTAALRAEVHDRQAAQNALRESEQQFLDVLDHLPIGVLCAELDGRLRRANLNFCRLTGRSETELLLIPLAELAHPEDRAQGESQRAELVQGVIPSYRRHERYLRPDGRIVWVQATVSLMRDAAGQPRSILGVVEDITERRQLEEAERGRKAAEAANRAKSDFLSRMSHELRTPLNAVLGFAQLLELNPKEPLTDHQKPWVAQIQRAGWHLLEMINDVLDLSRIESGNLRLQIEPLDVGELLAATRAMIEGDADKRRITITADLALGDATPLGDATRVKQILINLLSNAVKYNTDGGRIHIAARRLDDEQVELVVADTGLGLTAAQLAALFQPFNRLGRERSGPAGTGIGLVISQRLAELMGGSLTAHSTPRVGSAFTLTLPAATDPDTVRSDLDPLGEDEARYHRRRVHYVEDNETNVEVMRGILAQRPQVELGVSLTGLDGLASIRASRPDLILLDMNLPDISGMELLRHLKQDPSTHAIPIVVVSADALSPQIDAAFAAGCQRYLTKPVDFGEVLAMVDAVLAEAETRFG